MMPFFYIKILRSKIEEIFLWIVPSDVVVKKPPITLFAMFVLLAKEG
jgi:hypothetical protein